MSDTPPGWYPQGATLRWWDGQAWGPWAPPPNTTMAVLAHLGAIFGSILVPLVLYFVADRNDGFGRRHIVESLNFQITLLLAYAVLGVGGLVFVVVTLGLGLLIWIPLMLAVQVGALVLEILAAVAASRGDEYRYPVALRLVKG